MSSRPTSAIVPKPAVFHKPQPPRPTRSFKKLTIKKKTNLKTKKPANLRKQASSPTLRVTLPPVPPLERSVTFDEDFISDDHDQESGSGSNSPEESTEISETSVDEKEEPSDSDQLSGFNSGDQSPWPEHEPAVQDQIQIPEIRVEEIMPSPLPPENIPSFSRKTPETLVQLMDDQEEEEANAEETLEESNVNEDVQDNENETNQETEEEQIKEIEKEPTEPGEILAHAIAENKRRLAEIVNSDDFSKPESLDKNIPDEKKVEEIKSEDNVQPRAISCSGSSTLPSSVCFTPESGEKGSYNDILDVLEKLEAETEASSGALSEDKDSGRPMSDQPTTSSGSGSTSASSSPMRKQPPTRSASVSNGNTSKINDLMDYLDTVENQTPEPSTNKKVNGLKNRSPKNSK